MTNNMIAQCQRNHTEFCFVVKPAPGSRKITFVGHHQLHEIDQMLFISNNHVLMKFRGGKSVTLLSNGSILHQEARIQVYLDQNSKIVGESQIYKGKKTVLLEQKDGEESEKKTRYIALQFDSFGIGKLVGIYNDYSR